MEKDNYDNKILNLIKNKEYNEFFELIKNNKTINLDIIDNNYNYILNYLVNDNKYDIINFILENTDIRLDILDSDGRNILYNPIKFNNIKLLKLLIEYNNKAIGLNILDILDNSGNTSIFYACKLNNLDAFKILYFSNSNINLTTKDQENIYEICFKYKRNDMLLFLLQEEYSKNNNLNIYNLKGETILQLALTYENDMVLKFLMNLQLSKEIINNRENEYGLNALQQSIIINNNIISYELLKKGIDINLTDSIGNSSFHYSLYENNFDVLNKILENEKLDYNLSNSNGNIPLHICFDSININNSDGKYNYIEIFTKILKNSNINYLNNEGNTPVHLLIDNDFWKNDEIEKILRSGDLVINIFIKNNENNTPLDLIESSTDKEKFIDIVVDAYYNNLLKNKNLIEDWEKYCASNDLENLLKSIKRKPGKETKTYCKDQIRKLIDENIRSIPKIEDLDLQVDEGIYMSGCYYTGSTLDILYGLVYLHSLNKNLGFILEYPLVDNNKLLDYYKQLGINENYKLEFSNIEIIWVYQKIILPTNFDSILKNKMSKNYDFIIIPLGIDTPVGSHANMIIIDTLNKTVERFEPNGSEEPRGIKYNETLLDDILSNKFKLILEDYKYMKPKDFLPVVGFQLLEVSEKSKCTKIGDPNGFCAVWCVWWTFMRIKHKKIKQKELALELIRIIKFKNIKFKNLIRNFSNRITSLRDEELKKYNLTIDDWMLKNYDENIINKIEEDVLNTII
jgi:ankyrin repeat protein